MAALLTTPALLPALLPARLPAMSAFSVIMGTQARDRDLYATLADQQPMEKALRAYRAALDDIGGGPHKEPMRRAFEKVARGENVLIIGSGGTGKSFFLKKVLKYLRSTRRKLPHSKPATRPKQTRYLAMAATNTVAQRIPGGSTFESALSISDVTAEDAEGYYSGITHAKTDAVTKEIRARSVLVGDEIFFVSERRFRAYDHVVKYHVYRLDRARQREGRPPEHNRRRDERPFGGRQLVLFGDPLQLKPVEGTPLQESRYFNELFSLALGNVVVFEHNFRVRAGCGGNRNLFIQLLESLRMGRPLEGAMVQFLHGLGTTHLSLEAAERAVRICCTRAEVRAHNARCFEALLAKKLCEETGRPRHSYRLSGTGQGTRFPLAHFRTGTRVSVRVEGRLKTGVVKGAVRDRERPGFHKAFVEYPGAYDVATRAAFERDELAYVGFESVSPEWRQYDVILRYKTRSAADRAEARRQFRERYIEEALYATEGTRVRLRAKVGDVAVPGEFGTVVGFRAVSSESRGEEAEEEEEEEEDEEDEDDPVSTEGLAGVRYPLVLLDSQKLVIVRHVKFEAAVTELGEPDANGFRPPVRRVIAHCWQIPLAPAHAITVHSAQGATMKYATIDVTSSFAKAQLYVALSRMSDPSNLRLVGLPHISSVHDLKEKLENADPGAVAYVSQFMNQPPAAADRDAR